MTSVPPWFILDKFKITTTETQRIKQRNTEGKLKNKLWHR